MIKITFSIVFFLCCCAVSRAREETLFAGTTTIRYQTHKTIGRIESDGRRNHTVIESSIVPKSINFFLNAFCVCSELEQLQNEKRKALLEHETAKLRECDEALQRELRDWKSQLHPRKQVYGGIETSLRRTFCT